MATRRMESQHLPRISTKIQITCPGCSKQYRVPAEKAGKRVRCRKCKAKMEVPARDISMRSRKVILEELGITHYDQPTYKPEGAAVVDGIDPDMAAMYGMGEDSDDDEASDGDGDGKKKKKKELKNWVRREDPSKANKKALATSTLVLFGGMGFARSVLFLGWIGAVIVGVVLAALTYKVAVQAYAQSEHTPSNTASA